MDYSSLDGPDTALAGVAHLGAIVGPLVPLFVYRARRDDDPFVAREAAKAANAGMAFFVAFAIATIVEMYVPLVGFIGRMGQLAVVVAAVFLCIQAFRRVKRGVPTSYPFHVRILRVEA